MYLTDCRNFWCMRHLRVPRKQFRYQFGTYLYSFAQICGTRVSMHLHVYCSTPPIRPCCHWSLAGNFGSLPDATSA